MVIEEVIPELLGLAEGHHAVILLALVWLLGRSGLSRGRALCRNPGAVSGEISGFGGCHV